MLTLLETKSPDRSRTLDCAMPTRRRLGLSFARGTLPSSLGFYICRFALSDLTLMLDKFVKRGSGMGARVVVNASDLYPHGCSFVCMSGQDVIEVGAFRSICSKHDWYIGQKGFVYREVFGECGGLGIR
jgi:hypothetical protein